MAGMVATQAGMGVTKLVTLVVGAGKQTKLSRLIERFKPYFLRSKEWLCSSLSSLFEGNLPSGSF
jgi:hypothetical protein